MGPAGARIDFVQQLGASWVLLGDQVILFADDSQWDGMLRRLASSGVDLTEVEGVGGPEEMFLVIQQGRLFQLGNPEVRVLLDKGRYLAIQLIPDQVAAILRRAEPYYAIRPLPHTR